MLCLTVSGRLVLCVVWSSETGPGRAFMSEASLAKDHAIALVENWIEGSLDPLFHAFNTLADKARPHPTYPPSDLP